MSATPRRRNPIRRLTELAAATLMVATAVPASAGIDPLGEARIGQDIPFASSNVDVLGEIPLAGAVGIEFDDRARMYVTGASGLTIFDISDPTTPVPLGELPLAHYENEDVSVQGDTLLIASGFLEETFTNILYVVDVSNPRLPMLKGAYRYPAYGLSRDGGATKGLGTHTAECSPGDCRYAYLASNSGIEIVETATGRHVGTFGHDVRTVDPDTGRTRGGIGTHDLTFDSEGYAWVTGGNGTFAYDMTNPVAPRLVARTGPEGAADEWNDFIHHNANRLVDPATGAATDIVLVTEEDYTTPMCEGGTGEGRFETWRLTKPIAEGTPSSPAMLAPVAKWTTADGEADFPTGESTRLTSATCSAHWFTVEQATVAIGWYEGGTRFLQVDPATGSITQVGYWDNPGTMAFASYWAPTDPAGEVVYTTDETMGVHVLRFNRSERREVPVEIELTEAELVQRSSVAERYQPHPVFGWSCRLPV